MNSFERLLTGLMMICAFMLATAHTIQGYEVVFPLWILFVITFILFRLVYKDEE